MYHELAKKQQSLFPTIENEKIIKEQSADIGVQTGERIKVLFALTVQLVKLPLLNNFRGIMIPSITEILRKEMADIRGDLPALIVGPVKLIVTVYCHDESWPYLSFLAQAVQHALPGVWIANAEQVIKIELEMRLLDSIGKMGYADIKVHTVEVNDANSET